MNELEEGITFYESHLPEEMVEECRAETNDRKGYVRNLIEKYKENSDYIHNKLNKINEEEK